VLFAVSDGLVGGSTDSYMPGNRRRTHKARYVPQAKDQPSCEIRPIGRIPPSARGAIVGTADGSAAVPRKKRAAYAGNWDFHHAAGFYSVS